MCGTKMEAEGLPYNWRERGTEEEVLSGADFLSVLLRSPYYQSYTEGTTRLTSTLPVTSQATTSDTREPYIRHSRSTPHLPTIPQSSDQTRTMLGYPSTQFNRQTTVEVAGEYSDNSTESSESDSSDGVIVGVSISSSIGRKDNNINVRQTIDEEDEASTEATTVVLSSEYEEPAAVASEEHPSLVSGVSNSELTVDEGEPITTNKDLTSIDFDTNHSNNFPANVRPLTNVPTSPNFSQKLKPFHDTVIFHDNPREANRARSVSYSAVIQTLPHERHNWNEEKIKFLDRHERHYDDDVQSPINDFSRESIKSKRNLTRESPVGAETNHFFVTSNPEHDQNIEKNWEAPEVFVEGTSTEKTSITTERNWEHNEKSYTPHPHPPIYGQPEQNYEIDESVSVMSNGRVHGVQPSQPQNIPKSEVPTETSKKVDDNQKVGYVVEGRNYRKYRVEERTSDGFIVGEYGVVSHDDGSLRGVRYTADGTINPRLIYDALMKFLSL